MKPRPHFRRICSAGVLGVAAFLAWPAARAVALDRKLGDLGVTFHVQSRHGQIQITPTGLRDNSPLQARADGEVKKALVLDLNADGAPELYLIASQGGRAGSKQMLAFGTSGGQKLRAIPLPPLTPAQRQGYLGNEEFSFMEGFLLRRFAISPTTVRQLQYRLQPDPAGWKFQVVRTVEF